jgi:hypothetical protein
MYRQIGGYRFGHLSYLAVKLIGEIAMAPKNASNNHVNNPTAYEKGSMAPVPSTNPAIAPMADQEALLTFDNVMTPQRPSSEASDTAAEMVDHEAEASRSPELNGKNDEENEKTSARGSKSTKGRKQKKHSK